MDLHVTSYAIYLVASIILTVWVANVLFKNGRVFLVDIFEGNIELAQSVNKLLLVGFYLINFAYASMQLKVANDIMTVQTLFEVLSLKIGMIILILGLMHFLNLIVFFKLRKNSKKAELIPSTVKPSDLWNQSGPKL